MAFSLGAMKTAMYTGAKPYLLSVQLIKKGANAKSPAIKFTDMSTANVDNLASLPDEGGSSGSVF